MENKIDEVVKALKWYIEDIIDSNIDTVTIDVDLINNTTELIEQLKTEVNQTAKDRDRWKVVAEASRDVIQPQLRDRIAQLEAENEGLKAKSKLEYLDGANYAMYEICKETDTQSQDIRNSEDTVDGKCARIAERLKASQPVRCKNCNEARKIDDYFWCEFFGVSHDGEDYCNCGERRVEE